MVLARRIGPAAYRPNRFHAWVVLSGEIINELVSDEYAYTEVHRVP